MKKNNNVVIDFLYYLLYAGLFSSIVVLCFSNLLGISELTWKHGAILLLSIGFLSFAKELKKRHLIYVIILGIMLLAFLVISVGKEKSLLFVQNVLYLPFNKDINSIEERSLFEFVWILLISAASCVLQFVLEKTFFLKIVSAFAIADGLIFALFSKQKMPKAAVVFSVLYCVLVVIEWIQITWRKQRNERSMQYILWIIPFLILYSSLLFLMPAPEAPYSWQWVKRIYHNAEEKVTMHIENFMNWKNEDMMVSGFSEKSGLFSEIRTEQKQLMNIKVRNERDLSLYLTGKVFDSFDGRVWKSSDQSADRKKSFDTLETLYALARYSKSSNRFFYKNIEVDVTYQFFHTNYLLAPSKTWKIDGKGKSVPYYQKGPDYVFYRKAGYGTEYSLQYFQLNMDRELISDFLQVNLEDDVDAWKKIVKAYAEEEIALEDLDIYRKSVRDQYLKNIEISPEVEEWLSDVTADARTDVEKLYCIEKALAEMEYNINPGKLPETVTDAKSFLDYFLLKKREGYCSHYATSFVLLAQAAGFPARYVQGFCIPIGNEKETIVYSDRAHAWPEVYIDGKGWISFEPTPGFASKRYIARQEDNVKNFADFNVGTQQAQEYISLKLEEALEETPEEFAENDNGQSKWISYLWKIMLLILITTITIFAADRIHEKRREKRRNAEEKYRMALLQNLYIMTMLGYERKDAETYHEWAERIRATGADEYEIPVAFIETYENVLYGTKEIGEQELESCLRQQKQLLERLQKDMGKKYILCKVKLYIMRYR